MQPSTVRESGPILINKTLTMLPASINFTIHDDNIALETVEAFSITLNSSDSSVVIGGPGRYASAQISIVDDDGECAGAVHCKTLYCNLLTLLA